MIWVFLAICLLIPFHLFHIPRAYTAEIPNIVLREFDNAGEAEQAEIVQQPEQGQPVQGQEAQGQAFRRPKARGYKTDLTVVDVCGHADGGLFCGGVSEDAGRDQALEQRM